MSRNLIHDVLRPAGPHSSRCAFRILALLCGLTLSATAQQGDPQPQPQPADEGEGAQIDPVPTPAVQPADPEPKPPAETKRKGTRVRAQNEQPGAKPERPASRRPRRQPAKPTTPPETPAVIPDPAANPESPPIDPATGLPLTDVPAGPTETVESDVDADVEQLLKPAEERMYSFSIQDGTYADLVRAFSRMSGLGVLGQAPEDTLTYVSTEQMDYKTAMSRVRELLFKHPENYYIWRTGNSLELIRMNEALRSMPLDRIYTSVRAFKEANLDKMELVMVVYTPEGDPGALDKLRDFMPDYARIAPYHDKNAITIFALVDDVNKYIELVGIFRDTEDDPRKLEIIELKHITPSLAVEMLPQLMPSFQQRGVQAAPPQPPPAARPGRKNQPAAEPVQSLSGMQGQEIALVPYDSVNKLFVRALPDKIAEVKEYLAFIDVKPADDADPVIIPLQHVRVEQMITLIGPLVGGGGPIAAPVPAQPENQPAQPRRRPRKIAPQMSGNAVVTDTLGLYANPANNTLIVIGEPDQVDEVRRFVTLYDIPTERKTVRVALEHADAAELVQLVTDILANKQEPGVPVAVHVVADPAGNAMLITGTPTQVALAESIVKELDLDDPDGRATMHTYKCKYAAPSFLVGLLTTFDNESAAPPVQAVPQPAATTPDGQPVKKPVRPTKRQPRKGPAGAGKFHANDETGMLIVICNQPEWENDYKPVIELLDSESAPDERMTLIPVEKADPAELIETVNRIISPDAPQGSATGPTLLARPEGIMVIGGTDEEFARVKALVTRLDEEQDKHKERRTFTLQHANPAEVKAILEALLQKNGAAAPPRKPSRPQPNPNPAMPAPAVMSGPTGDIQIVESGRRDLIVVAPTKRMPEIEQLIKELDVNPVETETRVYDFPPGTNVSEVANSLASLHPGSAAVQAAGGPRPAPAKQPGPDGDVRFIPQVSSRKILVSAPLDLFPAIEKNIEHFQKTAAPPASEVVFYEVKNMDAATLAESLQPILEAKHADLVAAGDLPEAAAAQPGRQPGQSKAAVSVTAHPQGGRVLVVAPTPLQELVPDLLKELDSGAKDKIMRTVQLERANPEEMVVAINAMLGNRGGASPPRQAGPGRNRGNRGPRGAGPQSRPTGVVASAESQEVTVVAAPGGSAVVISGLADAVEEVETWIKELDVAATPGKQIKIYAPKNIEVEKFADAVMALVDSGGGAEPPKAKVAEDDEWDIDVGGPRIGKDIDLIADYWGGTILASASPAKIKEIDHLFEMYEGKDGGDPEIIFEPASPYTTYELKYRDDTYDAVYELEGIIDALWSGSEKPKIDYIPWTKIIVVKGKPDTFKEVEELITKYVDKETEASTVAAGPQIKMKYIKGMPAAEFLLRLKDKMGDKLQLDGVPMPGEVADNMGLQQIAPCVLPLSAVRAMSELVLTQAVPPGEGSEPASRPSTFDNNVDDEREKIRRSLEAEPARVPEMKPQPPVRTAAAAPPAATQPAATAEDEVSQVMRATVDLETNTMILQGPRDGLKEIEALIEEIEKDLEGRPQPPDIRVFRLKNIDVNAAAQILEQVFNAARQGGMTPQQIRALQAQQLALAQGQQVRGGKQAKPVLPVPVPSEEEKGKADRGGRRGGGGEAEEEPEAVAEAAQQEEGQIRVVPDARTKTIIIRAATEQYPSIIKLLATIDKPGNPTEFRTYQLKKLNAADVEVTLKNMLGLDGAGAAAQRRQPNPRMAQVQNQMNAMGIPLMLELPGMEGESATLDAASQVKISSLPDTNTILAMAPEKTLDLIGKLIEQLEDQEAPQFVTKFYSLRHGDAEEVVGHLEAFFGKGGRPARGAAPGGEGASSSTGGGYDPQDVNNPIFVAETRTNRLMVRALELDLPKIEPMIAELDVDSGGTREVVSVTVANLDAVAAARTLQEVYSAKTAPGGKQASAAKAVRITGEQSSNTIFVDAPPSMKDEILAKIKELDLIGGDFSKPKFLTLRFAKPSMIAPKLQDAFGGRSGKAAKVKVTGDDASMQLMVVAPADTFADIQEMIAKIDVAATGLDIKIYPLKHARAADVLIKMTDLVQKFLITGKSAGVDLGAYSAVADERLNSLIVAGGPTIFPIIESTLASIDIESAAPALLKTQVFPLLTAQAGEVAAAISRLFGTKRPDGLEPPRAEANPSSNSVVVLGAQSQIDEIGQMILKLEEQAVGNAVKRDIYQVRNARAAELANVVALALTQARVGGRAGPQVTVVPNEALNQLVIIGVEKDIAGVKTMIDALDQKADDPREIRTFKLTYAEAGALAEPVKQLFRSGNARPSPREQVDAYPDWGSNSLVVSASPENMARIDTLIQQFDVAGSGERGVHVVEVDNADAAAVARSLSEIFVNRGRNTRGQETISISNPQGTSSLMIRANEKELADIKAVVATLDSASPASAGEIKVVPLKFTDATETQAILQEYLRKPGQQGGRGPGADLAGDVRISVSADTNSLVISGAPEQIQQLEGVIAKIDVELPPEMGTSPKIIKLEHALASAIQPSIEELFSQQRQGPRGGRSSSLPPPVIVADDGSNALIVRASPVDFNAIKGLVAELDNEGQKFGGGVKIVRVATGVNVSDMAAMIEESFNTTLDSRPQRPNGPREQLKVSADPRTNSLVLAGAPSLYGEIEQTVRALEKMGPTGDRKTIIVRPKNMNVDDIKAVMEQMIQDNSAGTSGSGRSTPPRRQPSSESRGNRRPRQ